MSDGNDWSEDARVAFGICIAIAGLVALILVGAFLVGAATRGFQEYDRWACRRWCGAQGVKSLSSYSGCECR